MIAAVRGAAVGAEPVGAGIGELEGVVVGDRFTLETAGRRRRSEVELLLGSAGLARMTAARTALVPGLDLLGAAGRAIPGSFDDPLARHARSDCAIAPRRRPRRLFRRAGRPQRGACAGI